MLNNSDNKVKTDYIGDRMSDEKFENETIALETKELNVDVRTDGLCHNYGSRMTWECRRCQPKELFTNLIDLICHTIKNHESTLNFKCNLCGAILENSALLAQHFDQHSNINLSVYYLSRDNEENSQSDTENFNDDSDSEPLVNKISGLKLAAIKENSLNDSKINSVIFSPKVKQRSIKSAKRLKKNVGSVKLKAGLCDTCGKCYKGTFWKHKLTCHVQMCVKESLSNEVKIKAPRKKHVKTLKGYLCSYCGKTFNKSCSLQTHYRVHTGEKPYNCSECGKNFSNRPNLKRHLLIHSGEKPYLCTLCGKAFNHPWTFKTHSYTHAGPRSIRLKANLKKYKCEFCNKEFDARSTLEMHIRVHTKERPYQCSYCIKRFSQKSSLNQHILNHTGHKPHKCQYCMKSFKYLVCLKTHIRTHTGERPYKCGVCEKAFSSQSNLYRHRATHTGLKRFKCDYCSKEFGQRSALGDHINIHTGARPYSCPHCSSSFANQSTLSKHVSKHLIKQALNK